MQYEKLKHYIVTKTDTIMNKMNENSNYIIDEIGSKEYNIGGTELFVRREKP